LYFAKPFAILNVLFFYRYYLNRTSMTPGYNQVQQQKKALQPPLETTKTEKDFLPVDIGQNEQEPLFGFAIPKEINDPAQWDEAWFANYE
jgi:hypothetical protein